jgi:hypothetical protein
MNAATLTGWDCVLGLLAAVGLVMLPTLASSLLLLLADRLSAPRPRQSPRSWVYDHKRERYVQPPEE